MTHKLIVNPEAEADLTLAKRWYDEKRSGLGSEFVTSVAEAFERIRLNPELFGKVFHELRAARVHHFPYLVIYRTDGTHVTIIAVYHTHRDPRGWQGRDESSN
ncbi:MAG TPA: type II toxin-antitoxin system RelE/ParE family toxin [Pirellulales bacterium]